MTHICVGKLTIIGTDNGLSHGRRRAIIWTNDGILLIRPIGTNFSEMLIGIQMFPFNKMYLKISSAIWRPFCLGLNVLTWGSVDNNLHRAWQWRYMVDMTCQSSATKLFLFFINISKKISRKNVLIILILCEAPHLRWVEPTSDQWSSSQSSSDKEWVCMLALSRFRNI